MVEVNTRPQDSRRHSYAMLVKPGDDIPEPADVTSAHRLPGTDVSRRIVELEPGEWILRGVANHHSKKRGYTHSAWTVDADGHLHRFEPGEKLREALKAWVERGLDRKGHRAKLKAGLPPRAGLRRRDMRGAGPPAAMVRLILADRAGIYPRRLSRTLDATDRLPGFRRGVVEASMDRVRAAARAEAARRQAEVDHEVALDAMVAQAIEDGIEAFVP